MARTFGANVYFDQAAGSLITGAPCTFASWVNVSSFAAGAQYIMLLMQSSGNLFFGAIVDPATGYYTGALTGGDFLVGGGGSIISTNKWQHYCSVYTSTTSRAAFIDGGNKVTNSASVSFGTINLCGIGEGGTPANNAMTFADWALWNAALTDAEVLALARGISPTLIRPANLKYYMPFEAGSGYAINRANGTSPFTVNGSPAAANHAPTMPPYDFSKQNSPKAVTVTLDILRPNADTSDGTWTNESGNQTNLFASIDETTADDDTTYIRSTVAPVGDVCKIALENPAGGVTTPMRIRYRYRKSANSTAINLQVRLLQGTTEVWSTTHNNITESYVTADTSITPSPAITDPNDLHIEFTATMA